MEPSYYLPVKKKKYGGLTDLYINQLMKEPNARKCMLGL